MPRPPLQHPSPPSRRCPPSERVAAALCPARLRSSLALPWLPGWTQACGTLGWPPPRATGRRRCRLPAGPRRASPAAAWIRSPRLVPSRLGRRHLWSTTFRSCPCPWAGATRCPGHPRGGHRSGSRWTPVQSTERRSTHCMSSRLGGRDCCRPLLVLCPCHHPRRRLRPGLGRPCRRPDAALRRPPFRLPHVARGPAAQARRSAPAACAAARHPTKARAAHCRRGPPLAFFAPSGGCRGAPSPPPGGRRRGRRPAVGAGAYARRAQRLFAPWRRAAEPQSKRRRLGDEGEEGEVGGSPA